MGTNSGDGGFEIDGKTHTFDVGDPDAPGVDPRQTDTGDLRVDDSLKDISKKTKKTLSQYLKGITSINPFPINGDYVERSLTSVEGAPTRLPADPINDPQFTTRAEIVGGVVDVPLEKRQAGPEGHTTFVMVDPVVDLKGFSKGKESPQKKNGHSLLPLVEKDNLPEPIKSYTNTVLSNNRFNNNMFRIGGRDYTGNQLKQVGAMLSLRGSQEFPAALKDSVNPTDQGSILGANIPSPNQLGILKVSNVLLEARDALESLSDNDDAPTSTTISPIDGQSWGALNNVEEQWAGPLNYGMVGLALALQSAMLIAFTSIGAMISLVGTGKEPPAKSPAGSGILGSWLASSPTAAKKNQFPPDAMQVMGIRGTHFPFGDALKTGVIAFFIGAEEAKKNVGQQVTSTLSNATNQLLTGNENAGFLIVVARTVIRSNQAVAAHIEKIAKAFASNPAAGIKAISGLLDVIRGTKIISALNVFTALGDAILSEDQFSKGTEYGDKVSTVDSLNPNAPGASMSSNRINSTFPGGNKLKLAWASNRVPATYLIPDSIATLSLHDRSLGSFVGLVGQSDPDSKSAGVIQTESNRVSGGARLSQESVQQVESVLDAEYMPFYFHDLRTNEIIGFHAFLAALSDDYAAAWESTEGYGRADPVKVYKSTVRKVGMSFYIVAADRKDFDEMWVKINKLVTLVYPQYTKGRTLKNGDNVSFVQPFSQLMGASPLVRIRLGDLLRSNYTRFALARLFGAADGDMKLNSTENITFNGSEELMGKFKVTLRKALENLSNEWHLMLGGWSVAMDQIGAQQVAASSGGKVPDQAPSLNIDHNDLPYFKFSVKKPPGSQDQSVVVEPQIMMPQEIIEYFQLDEASANNKYNELNQRYNSDESPTYKVIGGSLGYTVPTGQLRLTQKSYKKLVTDSSNQDTGANIDRLTEFMSTNNALVRSFESVQGKGLAGAIEGMNFDWYDNVTWELDAGSKAPKMCKVSITFAPIHDIAPGIDHLGYNRAPIYPVGGLMGPGSRGR